MKTLNELLSEANGLIADAKSGNLTDEKAARLEEVKADIVAAQAREKAIAEGEALVKGIRAAGPATEAAEEVEAKTPGEHFVKSVRDDIAAFKQNRALGLNAPEFKAAGDPSAVGTFWFPDRDRTVTGYTRPRLTVANLLTAGTVAGNGLVYFVELLKEGAIAAVAEGQQMSKIHYRYEEVREGLSKIAGLTDITDEMLEDLDYLASEVNGNLVTDLLLHEEQQLLSGDGVGPNVKGILNRDGILSIAAENARDNAAAIHRATTQISIASGREADAIVIHPIDFERERLVRDKNDQWISGGPLSTYAAAPLIWGKAAVITPAATLGQPLVGAFSTATLFRKGGLKVTSSLESGDNFETGKVTLKAQERLGLKVPKPAAFAKVTLATA